MNIIQAVISVQSKSMVKGQFWRYLIHTSNKSIWGKHLKVENNIKLSLLVPEIWRIVVWNTTIFDICLLVPHEYLWANLWRHRGTMKFKEKKKKKKNNNNDFKFWNTVWFKFAEMHYIEYFKLMKINLT